MGGLWQAVASEDLIDLAKGQPEGAVGPGPSCEIQKERPILPLDRFFNQLGVGVG
jgi:hypothetical protein